MQSTASTTTTIQVDGLWILKCYKVDRMDIAKCVKRYCVADAKRQTRKHGVPYKLALAGCKLISCNPTCKDTSFGTGLRLSRRLRRGPLYRRGEAWRRRFEKSRRRLFGTRKHILKDGFYVKMSRKRVATLRRRGAVSGCHEA
jgi:hypothetical protein